MESDWLKKIDKKYKEIGEKPEAYLEGLYYAKPITYWDYIETDTLLTLQRPRTDIPDEMVFIMYHQVTELIFKMILHEIEQLMDRQVMDLDFFKQKMGRIDRYFDLLANSFDIMTEGMEVEQYLKFRMTLTPASGFQSAQYRLIELACTDLVNLTDARYRDEFDPKASWEEKLSKMYWQAAGYRPGVEEKNTLLRLFEERYLEEFIRTAQKHEGHNIWSIYQELSKAYPEDKELISTMRHFDHTVNIRWVMAHFGAARKYLDSSGKEIPATGGSAWHKYMHPMYQKRMFFPALWGPAEQENWGKEAF